MADRGWNKGGQSVPEKVQPVQPVAAARTLHPALRWCRSIGIASALLGGFGLITEYFWWAAGFVYGGLALLLVDLVFDRFARHDWIRWVIGFALLDISGAFTFGIVVKPAPLGFEAYRIG